MSKDLLLSLVRAALTVVGSYLFGKNILGNPIDASLWQEIIGIIIALGSSIWGFLDKSATIEGILSAVRSLAIFVGGLLVASGKLSTDSLNSWLGLVTAILAVVLSAGSRSKTQQIADGTVKVETLPDGKAVLTDKKP